MARRPYGSGCLLKVKGGYAIRWRERQMLPDGSTKRMLRYKTLGDVSKKEANRILNEKMITGHVLRPTATFQELVSSWEDSVLPLYKYSTRISHQWILEKYLLPRFGDYSVRDLTRQHVQHFIGWLVKRGYAPNTIDHCHNVLSTILTKAVSWGYLAENPAHGVDMPQLVPVRPRIALTVQQAQQLLKKRPLRSRTMVGLSLLTGLRRGEIFALRWGSVGEDTIKVKEAVYRGVFDAPKTPTSRRVIPLCQAALELLAEWRLAARRSGPDDLVFGTRIGKPLSPNNELRRNVYPACEELGLPRSSWLTFRRTYSSWAHDGGVPDKVIARLMGHANVRTTLNVYTQVMDASIRVAAEKVGELFSNDQ